MIWPIREKYNYPIVVDFIFMLIIIENYDIPEFYSFNH
jgi:hypothetical protein